MASRKLAFAPPPEQNVDAWRALLGLDRGARVGWTLNREVRLNATPDRPLRPSVGAHVEVWKRVVAVHGDSAAIADARREQENAKKGAAIDEFIGWLDSEDFGPDPNRMRREAWR
jgi:hypothetical protein